MSKFHEVYVRVLDASSGVPLPPPAYLKLRALSATVRASATVGKRGGEPRLVIRVWPAKAAVDRLLEIRRALTPLGFIVDDSDASTGVVRELAVRGVPWPAGGSFAASNPEGALLDAGGDAAHALRLARAGEPADVPPGMTATDVLALDPPDFGQDPDA